MPVVVCAGPDTFRADTFIRRERESFLLLYPNSTHFRFPAGESARVLESLTGSLFTPNVVVDTIDDPTLDPQRCVAAAVPTSLLIVRCADARAVKRWERSGARVLLAPAVTWSTASERVKWAANEWGVLVAPADRKELAALASADLPALDSLFRAAALTGRGTVDLSESSYLGSYRSEFLPARIVSALTQRDVVTALRAALHADARPTVGYIANVCGAAARMSQGGAPPAQRSTAELASLVARESSDVIAAYRGVVSFIPRVRTHPNDLLLLISLAHRSHWFARA
jgi:hypothetical protein